MTKKIHITALFIVMLLFASACTNSNQNLKTEEISKQLEYNIYEIRNTNYKNLDLNSVVIKSPKDINEIYNIKMDVIKNKSQITNKQYIEDFKKQLTSFFPDETIDEKYINFQADGDYGEINNFGYHPLNNYKEKVLNDTIKISSLDYRSPNVYLCNFKNKVAVPQRMNKGAGARLMVPKSEYDNSPDSCLGTWSFKQYSDKTIKYLNDGTHNGDMYNLSGEKVSFEDAISYFENEYYKSLPYKYTEDFKLSVSQIGIVELPDKNYGYNFYATLSYNGIAFDRVDTGSFSGIDKYNFFSFQAFMIKKNDIDFMFGMPADMSIVKDGNAIKKIISVNDAIKLTSENLTNSVKFNVQYIELVYQMKIQGENTNEKSTSILAEPVWKLTCFNTNDKKSYVIYVNAVNGTVEYFTQW